MLRPERLLGLADGRAAAGGVSADRLRAAVLQRADMFFGNGLGPLADRVFRIGHLGDFADTAVLGTLAGIEFGLRAEGIPIGSGGLDAALAALAGNAPPSGPLPS